MSLGGQLEGRAMSRCIGHNGCQDTNCVLGGRGVWCVWLCVVRDVVRAMAVVLAV